MTTAADAVVGAPVRGATSATRSEFVELYALEFPRLAGYCAAMTGDADVGRDVAQEAFARLFARWVGTREPRAYLYRVATNIVRRQWRRARSERDGYRTAYAELRSLTWQEEHWIRDLVDRLPPRLRAAVLLHYYADLPLAEIAHVTGVPLGTVKRRLHEARRLLQTALEERDG